ncbi:MAG TPA: glycosyltransferase [Bacteroidales bacterium]|nr:glycosyltransferase [Bacteroidales bacterium]
MLTPLSENLRSFYNSIAGSRKKYYKRNRYYHRNVLKYYRMCIPANSAVLELGCATGDLIGNLHTSQGVGIDISDAMINIAREKYPDVEFVCENAENYTTNRVFDYIIFSGIAGSIENIQELLEKAQKWATTDTRVFIDFYNPLWNPLIKLGEKTGLKMPEKTRNWLSIDDLENFLYISGYQVIKRKYLMFFPKNIPVISYILNKFIGNLPFLRRLSLNHIVVARPSRPLDNPETKKCSVVITCRDEEGNIEGLVTRMPKMGSNTEIIFVEGHSRDNTVAKIQEMITKYPEKDIKMLKQKGIGQGDAFRYGFDEALGDFVIWLEADLTTPPEEAIHFWNAYLYNQGEYVNGSRFIYKMEKSAMPLLNFLGNRFFGILFTTLLKQRFTDTLCGFKAISKKNYIKIRKQIDFFGDFDPFGDFELIFGAIKNNLKVAEIPVHYQPRQYGESKAYGQSFFSFMKHAWLLIRMSYIAFRKFIMA